MKLVGKEVVDGNGNVVIGYTIEQVGVMVGRSIHCIQYWYKWAEENPDNPISQLLPPFIQKHPRGTRYWTKEAIKQIRKFKKQVPQGRPRKGETPMLKNAIFKYYKGEN